MLLFGPKALICFNIRAEHHNLKKPYYFNFIYCLGFFSCILMLVILFELFLTMLKKEGNYGERLPPPSPGNRHLIVVEWFACPCERLCCLEPCAPGRVSHGRLVSGEGPD